jgi:N-methylhydantoinase B/oxoprolinase/acetone carboxylase alpha subunit
VERQAHFETWRHEFNHEQPHESLVSPAHPDSAVADFDQGRRVTDVIFTTLLSAISAFTGAISQ